MMLLYQKPQFLPVLSILWLYPAAFRHEFREQMLLDFSDMANDAGEKGSYSFLRFWFRELYHFPASLLQAHWRNGLIGKVLRSRPVNYGVRNALLFGLAYGLSVILSVWISDLLLMSENSILDTMSVIYFDLFHTEHGLELIYWLQSAIASLVTGLVIGVVFAFLFADSSNRVKYTLITMICWFLSREAFGILLNTTNVCFYLGSRNCMTLFQLSSVLSALFLGLIFYLPNPENRIPLRFLALVLIGYPFTTYIYLRLLYKFSIIEGRTMFPALLLLLLIYIGSIFAIAIKSRPSGKVPWVVIIVATGYLLFPLIVHNAYFSIIPALPLPDIIGTSLGSAEYWSFYSRMSVNNAIYGIFLASLLECYWG
jgi:hypothetical protein